MRDWRGIVRRHLHEIGIDPAADAELVEELAAHVRDRFAAERRAGTADDEAMRAALGELDGHELLIPELAQNRPPRPAPAPPIGGPPRASRLAGLGLDLRYALRTLARSPGFAATAVLTVALSTSPAILAMSVGNWLFLRPIPGISEPERLVTMTFGVPTSYGSIGKLLSDDLAMRVARATPSVESIAGYSRTEVSIDNGEEGTRLARAEFVSWNYFDVLGTSPASGRAFSEDDERSPGGTPVVILGERMARRLFPGGSAVGEVIDVNGFPLQVIGVMPAGFAGSQHLGLADLWLTGASIPRVRHFSADFSVREPGTGWFSQRVLRLGAGVSPERATEDLRTTISAVLATADVPDDFAGTEAMLGRPFAADGARLASSVAVLSALCLLLVVAGAANLANLFGFRSLRRARETAVRRALGASGRRLAQLHAVESILLASAGTLLGLLLVVALQRTLAGVMLADFEVPAIPIDWRLVTMAGGLALGVGLLMALVPARVASRHDVAAAIGPGGHATVRAGSWIRRSLGVAQLALSLTLLVGALLFVRTLDNLFAVDPGVDPNGLTSYAFRFETRGYSAERQAAFFQAASDRIRSIPGVTAVATADGAPVMGGSTRQRIEVPGGAEVSEVRVHRGAAGVGYFDALGLELVAGRAFLPGEVAGSAPAAVLSASLARRLFGGPTAATGRSVRLASIGDVQVVGVAHDVWWEDPTEAPVDVIYVPLTQSRLSRASLLVRASGPAGRVDAAVLDAFRAIDPNLPVTALSATRMVSLLLFEQLLFAWVLGLLSATGFLLAAIGIHGLMSQAVVERTHEFGVRLALGAARRDIVRLVLRSALVVVAIGAPVGVAMAAVLAQVVRSQLYGVTPGDPVAYVVGLGALVLVVFGAGIAPAWSASRSDPLRVLR